MWLALDWIMQPMGPMSSVPWKISWLSPSSFWDIFSAPQPLHHVNTFISRRHMGSFGFFAYFIWLVTWTALKPSSDQLTVLLSFVYFDFLSKTVRFISSSWDTTCRIIAAHHLYFLIGHAVIHRPGLTFFFLLIPQTQSSRSNQVDPMPGLAHQPDCLI